jgi:hypothetical protein
MGFKKDHPNYQGYESDEYHVAEFPPGMASALQGFITGQSLDSNKLRAVINGIAGCVPMEPTANWGWNYLIEDLQHYVSSLMSKPMPKVMDFLSNDLCASNRFDLSVEKLNEFLEDLDFGYVLETDRWGQNPYWALRESVTSRTEPIETTAQQVKDICKQTLEHLEQAREHLVNTKSDRDRKDAIRDCLSAMETMLKTLSSESDIKDAVGTLRAQNSWGPDLIVKDGLSLWNRMHDLYPDIRHGNPQKSDLTDQEALYWLERITCYIRYMSRVKNR